MYGISPSCSGLSGAGSTQRNRCSSHTRPSGVTVSSSTFTTSAVTRKRLAIPRSSASTMKQVAQTIPPRSSFPAIEPPRITAFHSGEAALHGGLWLPHRRHASPCSDAGPVGVCRRSGRVTCPQTANTLTISPFSNTTLTGMPQVSQTAMLDSSAIGSLGVGNIRPIDGELVLAFVTSNLAAGERDVVACRVTVRSCPEKRPLDLRGAGGEIASGGGSPPIGQARRFWPLRASHRFPWSRTEKVRR